MPAGSKIFGSCNIWRPKDAQGEDFTSEYLTSSVYPPYVLDILDVSPNITKARAIFGNRDTIDIVPLFTGVDFRAIVQEHSQSHEDSLDVSPNFIGIEFLLIVVEYDHPHEDSLDVSPNFTGVEFLLVVVEYTHPEPDILDVTPNFTGISLVLA